ncbi:DUF6708 domain-containing protein [Psychrobacter sp. I-STPA6b]|uniref:DUF6708 domain-containing protein n=1 Tax=Psychrobacter sp. I-STPA6b TaxID=2585718 RepID=UPI001D0C57E0|nr:DUF6708 domain-containing protein [Psychrobacter sp. I-STPA6b]
MIHINGRHPIAKIGYVEVGKQIGKNLGYIDIHTCKGGDDFTWLDAEEGYPEITELLPQRTVVQFNSTYMELTGRHDRIKGDLTAWMILFLGVCSFCLYYLHLILILTFEKNDSVMGIVIGGVILLVIAIILILIKTLFTEIFTYTYFPIRFNRKTRKVYVRQANRKVEEFNWDELKFYMSTSKPAHDGADIKAFTVTKDGVTVEKMFAFPFVSDITAKEILGGTQLKQHFEFVRRYMESESEEQLIEVKKAIRYIHPVHQQRETPFISFQRVILSGHDTYKNMEYPKTSFNPDISLLAMTPLLWARYIGRLISINTSITPHFSAKIEAECQIDPNDPHDLNKHLPEGNLEAKPSLRYKITFTIILFISTIAMLIFSAFYIDMLGNVKGGDYPSLLEGLLKILTFGLY